MGLQGANTRLAHLRRAGAAEAGGASAPKGTRCRRRRSTGAAASPRSRGISVLLAALLAPACGGGEPTGNDASGADDAAADGDVRPDGPESGDADGDANGDTDAASGTCGPGRPCNLVAHAVAFSPEAVLTGDPIEISWQAENAGEAVYDGYVYAVHAGTDPDVSGADPILCFARTSTFLDPGRAADESATCEAPETAGTYWLGVLVDATDEYREDDELDNFSRAGVSLAVLERQADLEVVSIACTPDTLEALEATTCTVSVTNAGTGDTRDYDVSLVLSASPAVTTADDAMGSCRGMALAAGASGSVSCDGHVPALTPAGSYFVGAIADPSELLTESDESNNSASTPVTIR